jgi:hypothetical protein
MVPKFVVKVKGWTSTPRVALDKSSISSARVVEQSRKRTDVLLLELASQMALGADLQDQDCDSGWMPVTRDLP